MLWCFVIIVVVWGSFSVCFCCCCLVLLLLFSFSLLCFYTALLFVVFSLQTVFVFPTWTKRSLNTGEIRIPHPRKSTGTIPTTTQNVPNKLYIRTSTFRFSSQLPGSPTVPAVGLSGYISMLQWTSQGPRDVPNPSTCVIKCNDKFSLAKLQTINFSADVAVFAPVLE